MSKKYCTVIYEIVDDAEWGKTNPLTYSHHGLKSVGVSLGDLLEWKEDALEIMEANDIKPPKLDIAA